MRLFGVLLILVSLMAFAKAQGPQTARPANPQKLVPPSAYRSIPATVRAELEKHGCHLPETQSLDNGSEPINVVSGFFVRKDQLNWAAVCVIDDRPEILLLWDNAPLACSAEITSGWPLKQKFSEEGEGGIFLRKASQRMLLNYRRRFPEGKQPPITHDGLEVGNEQASLVYYCDAGKWLELRGND